jgi:hypothetical protein
VQKVFCKKIKHTVFIETSRRPKAFNPGDEWMSGAERSCSLRSIGPSWKTPNCLKVSAGLCQSPESLVFSPCERVSLIDVSAFMAKALVF